LLSPFDVLVSQPVRDRAANENTIARAAMACLRSW
jgi:hypothetical protein